MQRLTSLLFAAVLLPVAVFAVDIHESTARYTDRAQFTLAEDAAISVLSNEGAVQGNPDGSFAPGRTLNRAEFTKIALLSARVALTDSGSGCFPDVPEGQWFTAVICTAKDMGFVQGNPDGLFHPERAVNYAEAVKILVSIYGYTLPDISGGEWYTPYLQAATSHGVLLPENPAPGTSLTRGQMARLAAAFAAEADGQLAEFLAAEAGHFPVSSSSSSSVSSESSMSAGSSLSSNGSAVSSSPVSSLSVSSVSSSSSLAYQRFPATSHQLYLGTQSLPIADGVVHPDNAGDVRIVTLRFRSELTSVASVFLVDSSGRQLATLVRGSADNGDNKYRTWEALLPSGSLHLNGNADTLLGFEVLLKTHDEGGIPNELIEPTTFTVIMQEDQSGDTKQLIPTSTHFPQHQTVQAMITSVQNGKTGGNISAGKKLNLASFQFAGVLQPDADLGVTSLQMTVDTTGITASNWYVMTTDRPDQFPCSVNGNIVSCDIGNNAGDIGSGVRTFNVYADIAVQSGAPASTVRVSLGDPGGIGRPGAVAWTDGVGTYNWLDFPGTTVLQGPQWTVK